MTLADLIKREGSVLRAERWLVRRGLTISAGDIYRWLRGKCQPSELSRQALARVGIEVLRERFRVGTGK
jgi:hypothetical protein